MTSLHDNAKARLMARLIRFLLSGILALGAAACGGSGAQPVSPQVAVARASDRLRGTWVLVEFHPEEQLEPVLASLLSVQMGHLTVGLDGGNASIQGVGVSAQRTYTIDTAGGDQFTATIVDPVGAKYGLVGGFQGPELVFTSQTSPWRGSGRLRRAE
jgi:hypothetical protein